MIHNSIKTCIANELESHLRVGLINLKKQEITEVCSSIRVETGLIRQGYEQAYKK